MNKKYSWLELAEFFSVGSLFFGVITTSITKQILYSLTPLSFALFFNLINRQRYDYHPDKILEQYQQIQELHQDILTFIDDYKYQKLELEKLIEDAKKQTLELESSTTECLNKNQLSSIVTRLNELESYTIELEVKFEESTDKTKINSLINKLNSLSSNQDRISNYVYSELDKFKQSVNTIESRIKKIENKDLDFSNTYQTVIGNSTNLTGLSQYYPLQGLTQRLIREVKNSNDIKYFAQVETQKFLRENSLKYVQQVAKHSQWLAEIVVTYYNDHQCSQQDGELLSRELRQLAIDLSNIHTVYELRIMYKVITLFTYQISRFKHYKKSKYSWDYSMREKMLNVLNDCLSKVV